MNYINCVIPVRGNSSEVKNKNFKRIDGTSLIERNIFTLKKSKIVSNIIVTSEDSRFERICNLHKVHFVKRPQKLSSNSIMPDKAVSHALNIFYKKNKITEFSAFTQCTSPFLNYYDVIKSFEKVQKYKFDCLFTSYKSNKFIWRQSENNLMKAINHNKNFRLGRQYIKKLEVIENGALYIFKTKKFLNLSHRFFGKIGTHLMPEIRSIDINSHNDLKIANSISKKVKNEK